MRIRWTLGPLLCAVVPWVGIRYGLLWLLWPLLWCLGAVWAIIGLLMDRRPWTAVVIWALGILLNVGSIVYCVWFLSHLTLE